MKKNSTPMIVLLMIAMTGIVKSTDAQNNSPYWSLQGNSNSTTLKKLGTTNAIPVNLYTNNKVRMHIETSGGISIGNGTTSDPNYKFYVKSSTNAIRGNGTIVGVLGNGEGYGVNGTSTNGYGGYFTSTNSDGLDAYTSNGHFGVYAVCENSSGYGVYGSGGLYGVYGTGGSYGVYGNSSSGYGLRGVSSSSYGINASSIDGYGGYITSTNSDALDAYTSAGYFGVWAVSDNSSGYGAYGNGGSYGLYGYSYSGQGVHGDSYNGLGGYFHSTNNWALEAVADNSFYAGAFYGNVWTSGAYYPSDRRLKKNIEDVGSAMSIINRLQPKHYEFKNDAQYAGLHLPAGKHYGLIAQDLEQVLPDLVHTENINLPAKNEPLNLKSPEGKDEILQKAAAVKTESMDVKAVNYNELIPIMIAAMQEQNAKIEALTNQLNALMASTPGTNSNNASTAVKLFNTHLGQSTPNPANTSTSIQYSNVPSGAHAQLLISDANGKMIKQIQLSNSGGTVSVDVSSLSAGIYKYSLLVNGNLVETKTMQISK